MLVENRDLDGMKGLTTGWKRVKAKRTETGQVNRVRISTGRIDKGEADEYICVSSDVLVNEMRRCDEEVSG